MRGNFSQKLSSGWSLNLDTYTTRHTIAVLNYMYMGKLSLNEEKLYALKAELNQLRRAGNSYCHRAAITILSDWILSCVYLAREITLDAI